MEPLRTHDHPAPAPGSPLGAALGSAPVPSPEAAPGGDGLPPGLWVDPIRSAHARAHVAWRRPLALLLASGIMGGGIQVLWRLHVAPLLARVVEKGEVRTVRLQLDEGTDNRPRGGGQGGGSQAEVPAPGDPGVEVGEMPLRATVPLEALEAATPVPASVGGGDLALVPGKVGASVGSGLGRGSGGGVGGGVGQGHGPGRGSGMILSALGAKGVRLTQGYMDYADYVPPVYPSLAQKAHISGDVTLEVTIDEKGRPQAWAVVEGHPLLAEACLEVISQWKFVPVRIEGKAVRATFEVRIRFTLI